MHKSNRRAVLHAQKQSRYAQKAIGERSCIIKSNRGAVLHNQKQSGHALKQSECGHACTKAIGERSCMLKSNRGMLKKQSGSGLA